MPSSASSGTNWTTTFTASGQSLLLNISPFFWELKIECLIVWFRFAGRALEFIVGLFLLCNSAFILIFESGGAIRAVLVGLHAYFNLWCEARVGWKIFNRRRTAVHKIATLETVSQFDKLDDVCAICFHDLKPNGSNNVSINNTIIHIQIENPNSKFSYRYWWKLLRVNIIFTPSVSGSGKILKLILHHLESRSTSLFSQVIRPGSLSDVPSDPVASDECDFRWRWRSSLRSRSTTGALAFGLDLMTEF